VVSIPLQCAPVKRAGLTIAVFLIAATALAWGEKGHYIANEAATFGMPNDMPTFFYKGYPELIFLAFDPDRWRGGGQSLDAVNPPDHFLDYEYVAELDLPPDRYRFIALLGSSRTLRRYGISNTSTGFLPWKIAEMTELLTNEFRQWRFAPAGSRERDFIERDIIHVAGVLGHFVADSSNPHHATINYNGWILPNPNHYPYDCETHERFETRFVSHAIVLEDVTARLGPPTLRTDYFRTAVEFVRGSNALVETLYRIDRDGGFDVFRPVSPEAKAFTADRLAAGASLLRDLWWSAWRNSASRSRRRGETPPPD
jgi:hypothetical protein